MRLEPEPEVSVLQDSPTRLCERFDLALVDLDGVVYLGNEAVPGAREHLAAASEAGMRMTYVTNNAARPPREVAQHLRALGIPADPDDVVTSAQAAAHLLAGRLPPGAAVFVIGGTGLCEALVARGLQPVQDMADEPSAVVSGYHPDLTWRTVAIGALLVKRGLPWIACNTDPTLPLAEGLAPGNGALVDVVARFASRSPEVAGKPRPPLFTESVHRAGGRRPLVIGDRLDTDIEGAANAGLPSLLVLTGVSGLADLVAAPPAQRPSYLGTTLAALGEPHPAPTVEGDYAVASGWSARVVDARLEVTGHGSIDNWCRAAVTAAWRHLDDDGQPVASIPDPPSR
jgi:HAD superfamily hydrolase (TIGR01450 family)